MWEQAMEAITPAHGTITRWFASRLQALEAWRYALTAQTMTMMAMLTALTASAILTRFVAA